MNQSTPQTYIDSGGREFKKGLLFNGYDYTRQAWVTNGLYVDCGHDHNQPCSCYGRKHNGEFSKEGIR